MQRAWLLAALLAGCGDKAVDLSLQLPTAQVAAMYDTSCVTAVDVYVDGGNYPTDPNDFLRDCIDLSAPGATFQQVRDRIHGKLDTKIPGSGISGIEVFGFSGPCDAQRRFDYDLIFYGSAAYIGNDSLGVPITPNLSCTAKPYTIRPIDVVELSRSANCTAAAWLEGGKLGLATLSPLPFTDRSDWWGGHMAQPIASGVANISGLADYVGPKSCLAYAHYTDDWYQISCIAPPDQRVCATGGEIEAPLIDSDFAYASEDGEKINRYGGFVVGAVMTQNGTAVAPVPNATVTIDDVDADKGEVVYLDPPTTPDGLLKDNGGQATAASGLFGIYTYGLVHVTVTANGKSVKRVIGSYDDSVSAVLVKL